MRIRGFLCYSYFMKKRGQRIKNHLIPLERSKKVIRLDRRGKAPGRMFAPALICALLALLCMSYCLSIFFFMGYGTRFFLIWGVIALGFAGLGFLFWKPDLRERIPAAIKKGFVVLATVGVLCFALVEGLIFSQFKAEAQAGADYVIVLGAQWKMNGPSYVLQKRLDAAAAYLRENPDTMVIVSGGRGSNEPISEAEGMAGYLMNAGIGSERILLEDRSTDTNENLEFSAEYIDKSEDRVVVVTNDFHVYRATQIARKKGFARVEGLAAGSYPAMLPNNLLREFFGVTKDFLAGNM